MNRLIKKAGLAALGMASVSFANAQEVKPWSVSAALRGFYDDNIYTFPGKTINGVNLPKIDSFGFELGPSASYTFNRSQQTSFSIGYSYSLKWYEARDDDEFDHVHQARASLTHAFNERYKLDLREAFVIAQEPSVVDSDVIVTPARSESDYISNIAGALFSAELVERLSANLGYNNTYFDYEQRGLNSRSALLDRMEHQIRTELTYQWTPQTTGVMGYEFEIRDFNSNDRFFTGDLSINESTPALVGTLKGDDRDATQHFAYVGVRQAWNPQLTASLKGGVSYTEYDREDIFDSGWGPYADASLRWQYAEGSSLQVNATHRRSPTDVPTAPDQEATSLTLGWTHLIAPKLTSRVVAQYQFAEMDTIGGGSQTDHIFLGGMNLTYQATRVLALEAGYSFDRVDSDVEQRSFTRNRVFAGVRLTY